MCQKRREDVVRLIREALGLTAPKPTDQPKRPALKLIRCRRPGPQKAAANS